MECTLDVKYFEEVFTLVLFGDRVFHLYSLIIYGYPED
jgi:hypothetical protein